MAVPAVWQVSHSQLMIIYAISEETQDMEKDIVCGMQVDPAQAAGSSQYDGKTYYFCSKVCKTKFDANPSQFAK
jgi:YHS domain-containing protein